MNELYPIIRRARRPLIVNDAPPVAAIAKIEPAQASNGDAPAPPKVQTLVEGGGPLSGESRDRTGEPPAPPVKPSDAKVSRKRNAR